MIAIEGVDYSATPPGSAALRAAGKRFVVRYLARDWRGITAAEVQELTAGGIDIAVVYESPEHRPLDGYEAGAQDARSAQGVLVEVGLPPTIPIYFAVRTFDV
jgi:Rv2525c-like, glycoside hydrolase-like domain